MIYCTFMQPQMFFKVFCPYCLFSENHQINSHDYGFGGGDRDRNGGRFDRRPDRGPSNYNG